MLLPFSLYPLPRKVIKKKFIELNISDVEI